MFEQTFNLFSLRFTITAVICWSINISIVPNNAGNIAAGISHNLSEFLDNGFINHPLSGLVVCYDFLKTEILIIII